mmetsp:Transcript_34901/g.99289  ORF Transcript_34901/g.99289 Transcript_34901/m.99289 type:complete len:410 (+) Transcript_34901:809-2038(+)
MPVHRGLVLEAPPATGASHLALLTVDLLRCRVALLQRGVFAHFRFAWQWPPLIGRLLRLNLLPGADASLLVQSEGGHQALLPTDVAADRLRSFRRTAALRRARGPFAVHAATATRTTRATSCSTAPSVRSAAAGAGWRHSCCGGATLHVLRQGRLVLEAASATRTMRLALLVVGLLRRRILLLEGRVRTELRLGWKRPPLPGRLLRLGLLPSLDAGLLVYAEGRGEALLPADVAAQRRRPSRGRVPAGAFRGWARPPLDGAQRRPRRPHLRRWRLGGGLAGGSAALHVLRHRRLVLEGPPATRASHLPLLVVRLLSCGIPLLQAGFCAHLGLHGQRPALLRRLLGFGLNPMADASLFVDLEGAHQALLPANVAAHRLRPLAATAAFALSPSAWRRAPLVLVAAPRRRLG